MSAFELIYRVQFTLSTHSINTNEIGPPSATLRVFLVAIQYSVKEHFCFVFFFCVYCFVLFFVLLLLLLFYCFTPSFMTAMQITRIFKHPSLARNYFYLFPSPALARSRTFSMYMLAYFATPSLRAMGRNPSLL